MTKHAHRHLRAKMIRASATGRAIECQAADVEWIKGADGAASDAPKRFKMRAYTGGPMQVGWYGSPVVIDMAGLSAKAPLPILMNHDSGKIVGHADEVTAGEATLDLAGVVSGASDESVQVTASAKLGFPWKASVGARPDKMEFIAEGVSTKVNGKSYTGPLYVARKSTLGEVSFVPIAADSKTSVKVAASAAHSYEESAMDFQQWTTDLFCGAVPELTDAQAAKLRERYDAEVKAATTKPTIEGKAPPAVAVPMFDLAAIGPAYELHRAKVEAKAATYTGKIEASELASIRAGAVTAAAEAKVAAIEGQWPVARMEAGLVKIEYETREKLLKAELPKGPAIHSSTRDMTPAIIEAGLCQSLNLPKIESQFTPEILQTAHTAFHGRLRLQQALMIAAAANGYPASPGERITQGNCRDVIEHAMIRAAGTMSLSGLLSNVANKELLAGFAEEDQTWRDIAAVRSVSDFKAVTSYRMLDEMEYEELPPDGTMKHGTVSEESYTRQARTYAKMFALSRTDIINDDLGAFDDVRTRLGRGAARKFNNVFWAKFINNSSFFTAARGNYITGGTTNLGTDFVGLALGIAAFDAMRSTAAPPAKLGKRIGGTPTIMLVPPELEAIAIRLFTPIAAETTANVNPYANRYRPVKVQQLSDSTFTGYSATAWYLLRNPAILAPVVASFLDGVQVPTVESADADFNQLGIQFRGYHDFGCDQAEWLCGIKSKGAA